MLVSSCSTPSFIAWSIDRSILATEAPDWTGWISLVVPELHKRVGASTDYGSKCRCHQINPNFFVISCSYCWPQSPHWIHRTTSWWPAHVKKITIIPLHFPIFFFTKLCFLYRKHYILYMVKSLYSCKRKLFSFHTVYENSRSFSCLVLSWFLSFQQERLDLSLHHFSSHL